MRVIIIGLGLMGGSIARSLQRNGRHTIIGVDVRADARDAALAADAVQHIYASLSEFDGLCDVMIFATPVSATLSLMAHHTNRLRRTPLVMDIGNVKLPVYEAARETGLHRVFVGTHPMCGSERSGFESARADLFDGAPVWMVADDDAPFEDAERFWRLVGAAAIRRTEAASHDALLGAMSHMPQLIASVLGGTLAELGIARERLGPRGRDMTRIAGSDSELWLDTLIHNRDAVIGPLEHFEQRLNRARVALENNDLTELLQLLTEAREWQQSK